MTKSVLADALGHHIWATLTLLDVCSRLSEEQLAATATGTYGSIIDTMRHLVAADSGYLFTLTAGRIAQIEDAHEAEMDLAELRAVTEANDAAWTALLAQDLDPDADVVRHRDDGIDSHAPLGVRLAQAVHHGTDHRSQICTVLTTLGIEPPEIDVWAYAEKDGRIKEVQRAS